MDLRRRLVPAAALVAASVALHAALLGGLVVGLPGWDAGPRADPPVVSAVLVAPPAPVAEPSAPPVAAAVVRRAPAPRPTVARTAPAPARRAVAPVAQVAVDEPSTPVAADAFGAVPVAEVTAVDAVGAAPDAPPPARDTAAAPPPASVEPSESPPADTAALRPERMDTVPSPDPPAAPGPDSVAGPLPAPPDDHRQRFRVYYGDYTDERSVARLEYRFERDGDRYRIETAAKAEGVLAWIYRGTLVQQSSGRIGPDGLEPTRYAEQRGSRPERAAAFDADARRLVPSGGTPVALPPGTQDRLSVFYQIGLLVRAEPERFTAGRQYELPVASTRAVQRERFVVVGDEVLMAPGGAIRTLHLHRPPPAGTDDPRIDLWLGYDRQMLPVRLRIEDSQRRVLDHLVERDG